MEILPTVTQRQKREVVVRLLQRQMPEHAAWHRARLAKGFFAR